MGQPTGWPAFKVGRGAEIGSSGQITARNFYPRFLIREARQYAAIIQLVRFAIIECVDRCSEINCLHEIRGPAVQSKDVAAGDILNYNLHRDMISFGTPTMPMLNIPYYIRWYCRATDFF
ncbi:MAG: hypothetical protein JWM99_4667 [Verrucomicrobiales bacterium]|nr:hypothetical protein [Verrucomicrobiales bacterium]